MKNVIKSLAALAASLLAFNACNREVLPVGPSETHSLSFVADAPQTKTSVSHEGDEAVYDWSTGDEDRFTVYEINGDVYSAAQSVEAVNVDGKMMITATFNGAAKVGSQYFAIFNSGVQASQNATNTSYDQASDVLISEVVTSSTIDDDALVLCFKRETAFGLMTAKNLEGSYMLGASVTADKVLAADYDHEARAFEIEGSNTITVFDSGDPISEVEGGQSPIFFATVPVDDAILTVAVVTGDENGDFQAAYEKTFIKTISFARGDVHAFGTSLADNKVTSLTLDLSTDQTTAASAAALTWDETFVSVVSAKAGSTAANNYYPGTEGKTYTSTRFYNGNTLTFTPKLGISVKEIVYTATTEAYANALASSTWENATVSASNTTVTIVPTDGTMAISATLGATTGATEIVISYGKPVPVEPHTVVIADGIQNGTVTATPTSALPGTEITLTATPADGYVFDAWDVTNSDTEEAITVVNDKFAMPNADVNVSATFKEAASWDGTVSFTFVTHPASWPAAKASAAAGNYSYMVDGRNFTFTHSKTGDGIYLAGTSGSSGYLLIASGNSLGLPVVSGYTLTKVVGTLNGQGTPSTSSSVSITDGTNAISGGTAQTWSTKGESYTYNLTGTSADEQYYLAVSNKNCQMINLSLTYEKSKTLVSVTATGDATKKSYKAGDKFETAGLVATAKYDDNSTKDVTAEVTWTVTPETLTVGITSVSVKATYNDVTSAAYVVSGLTVTEPATLSSISVKTAPTKVTYTEGESFDPAGLVITRHYSDDTSSDYTYADHTDEFNFAPALDAALAPANDKVTITYQGKTVDQAITVNAEAVYSTMDEIFAKATEVGSTKTDVKIGFTNCVVTAVKGSNVYVTDASGTKGLIIYQANHGFEVGDKLNGKVSCQVYLYNGSSDLVGVTSSSTGLIVTKDGVVTPRTVSIASLSGVNTGAVLTFAKLTYNGTDKVFTDGANTITPYNNFITLPTLISGRNYQVTGVYVQYKDTKEIAPRSADDFVLIEEPYLTATANKTTGISADGEPVTITVATNVPSWNVVSSDNTNFVVGTKTATTVEINVAKNTDTDNGRSATITVSADGVDPVNITLTQAKAQGDNPTATYTALFGSAYNSKGVSAYNASWTATNDGFTVNLANWNNNNNGWSYIKAGNKNTAYVATITTAAAISEAITTITVKIDAITANNINSIKLYMGDSADSCTTEVATIDKSTGEKTVTISSPAQNKFYKLSFDCKAAANGSVQVSKVIYTNEN